MKPLLYLLLLSVLIKAGIIWQAEIVNPDGVRYVNSAHELMQGNIGVAFGHEKMLGYSVLLWLVHLVVPDWFLAGKLLSGLSLLFATIPLYLITQQLFSRKAAFYAALAYTVVPHINGMSGAVIRDPVYLMMTLFSLWFTLQGLEQSRRQFLVAGGTLGLLACTVRPEGTVTFAIVVIFLLLATAVSKGHRGRHLANLGAYVLAAGVVFAATALALVTGVVPWDGATRMLSRFMMYAPIGLADVYLDIYRHLKEVQDVFPGGKHGMNYFVEFTRHNIHFIFLLGMLQIFCKTLFPAFVLPLVFGFRLKGLWSRSLMLVVAVIVGFLLMDYIYLVSRNFIAGRYMLIPIVLSFTFVGYGMERLSGLFHETRYVGFVMAAAAVLLCVVLPTAESFSVYVDENVELKSAGEWLDRNYDLATTRILLNDERVAFYAGLLRDRYVRIHEIIPDSTERQALQNGCHVIVLFGRGIERNGDMTFHDYERAKAFTGNDKSILIFERKS